LKKLVRQGLHDETDDRPFFFHGGRFFLTLPLPPGKDHPGKERSDEKDHCESTERPILEQVLHSDLLECRCVDLFGFGIHC
jgi:hypothetical protein